MIQLLIITYLGKYDPSVERSFFMVSKKIFNVPSK